MNCHEVNQHLDALLDQALEPELAGKVETHVSQCAACRGEFERLQALRSVLQSSEISRPAAALEERVMRAFHEHHRQPVVDGWRRLIFGRISVPKPAFALMGMAVIAVLFVAFGVGRMTASQIMLSPPLPPIAAPSTPVIVEVPVERERIVYVKSPGLRGKTHLSPPSATGLMAKSSSPPSSASQPEAHKTGVSLASLDDFEPIKGTTARVIRGSERR